MEQIGREATDQTEEAGQELWGKVGKGKWVIALH